MKRHTIPPTSTPVRVMQPTLCHQRVEKPMSAQALEAASPSPMPRCTLTLNLTSQLGSSDLPWR
eukprot:1161539-Pelagomonas_calceolata.AAC.3